MAIPTKKSIHMLFQDPEIPLLSMVPILDNFYEGVMITAPQGIIIYFNHTQAKIDDLDPEHTLGKMMIRSNRSTPPPWRFWKIPVLKSPTNRPLIYWWQEVPQWPCQNKNKFILPECHSSPPESSA
ncbi:MAG: hypothetical protein QM498_00380 [Desulfobacterium sp.]